MTPAFICAGARTPIGRYGGALAPVRPDDMLAHAIREAVARSGVPGEAVDEVIAGCANQAGEDNRNVARMATLLAGLPDTVPAITLNRLCASGLDAVAAAARRIACGEADVIVAGGVESMTRAPIVSPKPEAAWSRDARAFDTTIGWRFVNEALAREHGIDSMPETGENVAEAFQISRDDQDALALRSQERALRAIAEGRLAREIAPLTIPRRRGEPVLVDTDEHPRETSMEALGRLRTPFREGGTVTAGNASGVNDGAAALVIASAQGAERHGLAPLARVAGTASVGVPPRIMGIGPAPATRKLLDRHGLAVPDIDLMELNEAFASQALAVLRELGLPDDAPHVNPNGGAIALGHPLGMSGARLALTAAVEMAEQGHGRAVCTMCVGVGQGVAMLLEAA